MKKTCIFNLVSITIFLLLMSCGENNSFAQNPTPKNVPKVLSNDSTAVIRAFEKLKTNKTFLKDLGLENEKEFSWNDDLIKIISGDLNNDGIADALMFFVIEGRGHGNNADAHYAIFLNENNKWNYQSQLDAGGNWAERLTQLDEIENGKIKGNMVGNKNKSLPDVPVEFIYRNKSFINTYTALHQTEAGVREYIDVIGIQTADYSLIPFTAALKDYQKLLGKGKIIMPEVQPECGTLFDEGLYSELHYPGLIIELSDGKMGACKTVTLKGTGYQIQTDKGTLGEKTTLNELKNILQKNDTWYINDEKNGSKTLVIFDGEESDNLLLLLFDKIGMLVSVTFFVQC